MVWFVHCTPVMVLLVAGVIILEALETMLVMGQVQALGASVNP